MAVVHANRTAVPKPWNRRSAMSTGADGASAPASTRTLNAETPMRNSRLRPKVSAIRPTGIRRAAAPRM